MVAGLSSTLTKRKQEKIQFRDRVHVPRCDPEAKLVCKRGVCSSIIRKKFASPTISPCSIISNGKIKFVFGTNASNSAFLQITPALYALVRYHWLIWRAIFGERRVYRPIAPHSTTTYGVLSVTHLSRHSKLIPSKWYVDKKWSTFFTKSVWLQVDGSIVAK